MSKAKILNKLIRKGSLLKIAGAHNGLTAKLVEEAGFDGVWSSGFEISTSHAIPDANTLSMVDFLNAAAEMASRVSVPVIADCDTGFGSLDNIRHMVRKYESRGVSAICIEDKRFPKINSFIPGRQELAPVGEFVDKISVAKNAQLSGDLMVFARVEALIAGWGQEEALNRAESYVNAGADGIFIHSKSNLPDEITNFCRAWARRAPLLISPTTYYLSEEKMQKLGVSIVIYANQAIRASIKYVKEILNYIKKYGAVGIDNRIIPMEEVFRLQGMHLIKDNQREFLKLGTGTVKAIIPAAGRHIDISLESLLEDKPVGMLDINGKSLLQRNIETFNITGIHDINIIVGYKGDKVVIEGAKIFKNPDFRNKGIMHSIIQGVDSISDKNIILYSDIILDGELLQRLLKREGDITIVVDGTYKKTNFRNKKLELVIAKYNTSDSMRVIETGRKNPVFKIGTGLKEKDAHFEFIGVALLSRKGMKILLNEYAKSGISSSVSFADFIQYLIDKGYEVLAFEVTSGWMEIHNFSDYKKACSILNSINS